MTAAHPRPDLEAYNQAARMSQPELVTALRELLGAKLVAIWVGQGDPGSAPVGGGHTDDR